MRFLDLFSLSVSVFSSNTRTHVFQIKTQYFCCARARLIDEKHTHTQCLYYNLFDIWERTRMNLFLFYIYIFHITLEILILSKLRFRFWTHIDYFHCTIFLFLYSHNRPNVLLRAVYGKSSCSGRKRRAIRIFSRGNGSKKKKSDI